MNRYYVNSCFVHLISTNQSYFDNEGDIDDDDDDDNDVNDAGWNDDKDDRRYPGKGPCNLIGEEAIDDSSAVIVLVLVLVLVLLVLRSTTSRSVESLRLFVGSSIDPFVSHEKDAAML